MIEEIEQFISKMKQANYRQRYIAMTRRCWQRIDERIKCNNMVKRLKALGYILALTLASCTSSAPPTETVNTSDNHYYDSDFWIHGMHYVKITNPANGASPFVLINITNDSLQHEWLLKQLK